MVFSGLVFLYAFLPLTVLAYFVIPSRPWRNGVLLLASLVFYGWGEPKFLALMLIACLEGWICGLVMEAMPRHRKAVCITGTVLLLGNLAVFKYTNFLCDNLRLLFPGLPQIAEIALPIGISFYTFQILSYVIDLYRRRIDLQKNFFYLALYVCCFPQLIAGPIVRYQTVEREIRFRQESLEDALVGTRRFILGLAKKVILANNLSALAETVFAGDAKVYGTLLYWVAAMLYALQIYFDFSGYSDMAIGLGRIFGFHFLENFNYPYLADSVTDFWRRWHISLSSWFRDYVYIPMGGNRVTKPRWILNILTVWALTGFWHGAQWNFILWGLYYGVLLLLEKLVLQNLLARLPRLLRWVYAMVCVLVGWMIFNFTDLGQLGSVISVMFRWVPTQWLTALMADSTVVTGLVYIPLGILCAFPWWKKLPRPTGFWGAVLADGGSMLLFLLCLVYIISSSYNPFIYFRF